MISVVIPLYNKEKDIINTVKSVLAQSYRNFEVIIVDDGSTDGSLNALLQFSDNRIRIITKENGGVCSARNAGIGAAKYDWIALLDADDLWTENHLFLFSEAVRIHSEDKIFATNITFGDKFEDNTYEPHFYKIKNFYKEYLVKQALITSSSVLIHRSVFDMIGAFNENLVRGEDIEMWDRILQQFPLVKIDVVTVLYNQEADNRAMKKRVPLENCFVQVIKPVDLEGGSSRALFLKHHVFLKLKSCFVKKEYKDLLKLLIKYNVRLLK